MPDVGTTCLQLTFIKHMLKHIDEITRNRCSGCRGETENHNMCQLKLLSNNKTRRALIEEIIEDLWAAINPADCFREWRVQHNTPLKYYINYQHDMIHYLDALI